MPTQQQQQSTSACSHRSTPSNEKRKLKQQERNRARVARLKNKSTTSSRTPSQDPCLSTSGHPQVRLSADTIRSFPYEHAQKKHGWHFMRDHHSYIEKSTAIQRPAHTFVHSTNRQTRRRRPSNMMAHQRLMRSWQNTMALQVLMLRARVTLAATQARSRNKSPGKMNSIATMSTACASTTSAKQTGIPPCLMKPRHSRISTKAG